jgi:hypothetical protein
MKIITLSQGQVTLVDDEDYENLIKHVWCAAVGRSGNFRAVRTGKVCDGERKDKRIYMSREIMNPPHNLVVDHADGNTLNNQRSNLRIASISENNRNNHSPKSFIGAFENSCGNWTVRIRVDGKKLNLGTYRSKKEAAIVYDIAAIRYAGDFAVTNYPRSLYAKYSI